MSKICCVGDAGICPKSSSCSMVLRSACSHGHSRESSTVKEHFNTSSHGKSKRASRVSKENSYNGALSLESALESSLKQLALKSAEKTYSLLKEKLCNRFEFSEAADQKLFETSALNVSYTKELQYSQLSASKNSSVFNNINHKECSSDYSSAAESDFNSSDSTSNMSRSPTKRLARSSLSSMRNLSESEGEDNINVGKSGRRRRSNYTTENNLNFNTSKKTVFSEREGNRQYMFNNHDSHFETQQDIKNFLNGRTGGSGSGDSLECSTDSPHLDTSSLHYSLLGRIRWFLWRCTYLNIIRNISFDVWLLSRIHKHGKHKIILYLLIPLLFFLVWNLFKGNEHNSSSNEALAHTLNSAISSVYMSLSSVFSSIYNYFAQQEEVVTEMKVSDASFDSDSFRTCPFFSYFSGFFAAIFDWIVRGNTSNDNLMMEAQYEAEGYLYKTGEEMRLYEPITEETKLFQPSGEDIKLFQPSREDIRLFQQSREDIRLFQPSREEIKILAAEMLKDEMNSLKEFVKTSVHGTEAEKLKKEQKLQNEMNNLRLEFQSLSRTMERLESDSKKQREKSVTEDVIAVTNEYKSNIEHLNVKLKTLETKLGILERLKNCCDKQWSPDDFIVLLEKHLISAFRSVVDGDSDPGSKYYFFNQWLSSKFLNQEKLMWEINTALQRQSLHSENAVNYDDVMKVVESTVAKHVDSIKQNLDMNMFSHSSFSNDIFSDDKIKKIVKEAIMLYDADKTGQVDYALESGGGSVLGTRCSETYVEKYGKISFFGVPLWSSSNSPRTAIQPDVQPGRCWAFRGSQGFLVLELSATIYPTGFTLEHIPISLSPTGSIDSAPKNFSVWGLESEKDSKGKLLGDYSYDIHGEPLQYFAVKKPSEQPYSYVELQIHSNHGNMEYTCLYRFRVHGQRVL